MNYITPVATTKSWVGDWDITIKKNILQKVASQRFVYEFCGPDDLFTKAFPDNRLPMLKSDEAWSKADDSATSLGLSPVKCAPDSFQGDKNGRPKLRRPPRSDSELPTKKNRYSPLVLYLVCLCMLKFCISYDCCKLWWAAARNSLLCSAHRVYFTASVLLIRAHPHCHKCIIKGTCPSL